MEIEFKPIYLVCLELGDEYNYVVARAEELEHAQELGERAREYWPGVEISIAEERVPLFNPLFVEPTITEEVEEVEQPEEEVEPIYRANPEICICGRNPGGCIGSLACRCSAIASCKRVTVDNPLDYENYSYEPKPDLQAVEVEVIAVNRGVVEIKIPAWCDEIISLALTDIPTEIRRNLEPDQLLMADVNLDAEHATNLIIDNLRYA